MKKHWWPPRLYELKARGALGVGLVCILGGFGWSLQTGHWTALTTLLVGVVLGICSAIILQMRREYRERSKWSRQRPGGEGL